MNHSGRSESEKLNAKENSLRVSRHRNETYITPPSPPAVETGPQGSVRQRPRWLRPGCEVPQRRIRRLDSPRTREMILRKCLRPLEVLASPAGYCRKR